MPFWNLAAHKPYLVLHHIGFTLFQSSQPFVFYEWFLNKILFFRCQNTGSLEIANTCLWNSVFQVSWCLLLAICAIILFFNWFPDITQFSTDIGVKWRHKIGIVKKIVGHHQIWMCQIDIRKGMQKRRHATHVPDSLTASKRVFLSYSANSGYPMKARMWFLINESAVRI